MSRSTRGTWSAIAVTALIAALVGAPVATSSAQAVDWTTVPGATADDTILTPTDASFHNGEPGFSFTARANGFTDYCASLTTSSCADYHRFFSVTSATVDQDNRIATVSLTPSIGLMTRSGVLGITFETSPVEIWNPVFSSTSHGWFHTPQLANGTLTPGGFVDKECAQGVLCTVQFYLTDDTNTPTGNKWLLTSFVGSGGQFVIPLTSTAPPASPPAAAFSASLSGTATHDWNFDGSASMAGTGQTLTRFQWTFGDGTTSITAAPTTHHTYADGSPHTASLVVLDSAGASSASVSHTLTEPMLVVNSAGDAPATDPSHGCDTGQKVQNGDTECTLRAAIQSLDAGVGGTEITFRLPAGSTTITATSALPHVTAANATILGSTSAMPVISGSGLEVIGASGVTIANLVILGGSTGVRFQDSPDGKLTGSYIGVTPSGQVSAPPEGVWVDGGGGYAISGNVIVATVSGMTVTPSAPITSLKVIGNSVGELPNGSLALGVQYGGGIGLFALTGSIAGADVEDNRIAGADTNLAVVGDQVIAPRIAGNTIGVSGDQVTLLGKATQNLRVDGAPGAQITGNTIAGAKWDLLVSGSVQTQLDTSSDGSQSLGFLYPGGFPLSSPITGTHVTVSGNSVGPVTRQDGANLLHGITVWNTANDTTISDNIARDHDTDEIAASGVATGLTVSNNVVGGAPGTPVGGEDGIVVADQTAPTVSTNTIGAVATGITIPATTIGAVVSGNTVGLWTDGTSVSKTGIGIDVKGAAATIGPDNTIGFSTLSGIFIHAAGAHVISNRIGVAKFGSGFAGNATGIQVAAGATGAKIGGSGSGNTIVGNVTGVLLEEQGAEVSWNKFGVLTGGILGNITAIAAYAAASVHDNTIAGSTAKGITVSPGNVVKILHNSIYGTTGTGIDARVTPALILSAPRVTHGTSTRTWLVLNGVPTGTGTIEVFGNPSCADPEGKVPLFTTPTTSSDSRVLSVADRADLAGFTVTVTTDAGTTRFSNCATAGPAADSDGDGIPDQVEFSYPTDPEAAVKPNEAAFVGDNQQWVVMEAFNGSLSKVSVLDDPDPSGHPGVSFPVGLIDWTVTGVGPGGSANVGFVLSGTTINSWWKYDPAHAPSFFDFSFTNAKGYGAILRHVSSDLGPSTVVSESVNDGGEGDQDGLVNGTVHDPAAPAVLAADVTAPAGPIILPPVASPVTLTPATTSSSSALASTGSDPEPGFDVAAILLMIGALVLVVAIRRNRSPARP